LVSIIISYCNSAASNRRAAVQWQPDVSKGHITNRTPIMLAEAPSGNRQCSRSLVRFITCYNLWQ
jgi:hypothetical protein